MRSVVWGVVAAGALGWVACVGDEPAAAPGGHSGDGGSSGLVGSSSGGASSGSSSGSSSGDPQPDAALPDEGGDAAADAAETGPDCARNAATGLCLPITLKNDLVAPYGVAVTTRGTTTLAIWVRGAPEAAGAVERCDVRQCGDSVVRIADIKGANGRDPWQDSDPPYRVSGRNLVTDGDWVRWISYSETPPLNPKMRDIVGGCSLLTGCINPPRTTYVAPTNFAATQLSNAGSTLFVRDSLGYGTGCDMGSCNTLVEMAPGDSYRRGIATDGTTVAWVDRYESDLMFCTRDGASCNGAPVLSGNFADYGDKRTAILDMAGGRLLGATTTTVFACTVGDCSATLHTLAVRQTNVAAIVTDGVNAYWAVTGNGTGAGDTGFIETCPVDGCGGTPPKRVASGLTDPRSLSIHAGFLYWVSYGNAQRSGSLQTMQL